eukprot:67684-Prorocentrum_minimum.AAC.1
MWDAGLAFGVTTRAACSTFGRGGGGRGSSASAASGCGPWRGSGGPCLRLTSSHRCAIGPIREYTPPPLTPLVSAAGTHAFFESTY